MVDKRQVGVRCCGGCDPRYDRVALVRRIDGFFPETEFVAAQAGVKYPVVLVVRGYPSRCANISDLVVPTGRLIYPSGWGELLPVKEKLAEVLKGQQARSLTHEEMLDVLPHRGPMLFTDTVGRLVPGGGAVASFRARSELSCFASHLLDMPAFPGVYTTGTAAQTADTLMITMERYVGKPPLFMGVREVTFRRKILPGDSLEIHVSFLEEKVERTIAAYRGQVFVGDMLAANLEPRLAFRQPNKKETMR